MTGTLESLSLPTPDFDSMTKNELLAYAEKNGVGGVSAPMKKAEILEAIKGAV